MVPYKMKFCGACQESTEHFDDRTADTYDYQNVYYGRDRGEKNCGYKIYKDEAEYLAEGFNSGEDYILSLIHI